MITKPEGAARRLGERRTRYWGFPGFDGQGW